jgi:3-phosphoshikimate 1-carboxyvinyltransferase
MNRPYELFAKKELKSEMSDPIEIRPVSRLNASVRVPGSKSYTQRALVIASLAEGRSLLHSPLISEDTGIFTKALSLLGAKFVPQGEDLLVTGTGGRIDPAREPINLGNNGTAARFLLSVLCLGSGDYGYGVTGTPRLCERPVKPLLDAIRSLGGAWTCEEKEGYLPLTIHGGGIRGGRVFFDDVESSQYVSSLLISAPFASGEVEIQVRGSLASRPYVNLTLQAMEDFGVQVETDGENHFLVRSGQRYRGTDYSVEGDASSASYFFLAAALTRGTVRVSSLSRESLQGDGKFLHLLEKLGCAVSSGESWVQVKGNPLKAGEFVFDMSDMPDMVPTLAVLSALRPGRTVIRNAAHLRIKESNRLEAMARELAKTGIHAEEREDGLVIDGGAPGGAEVETYNDHRIAMSFAMMGLVVPGIRIRDGACVRKSFPGFWAEMGKLYGERP